MKLPLTTWPRCSIKASGVHQPILVRPLPGSRLEETSHITRGGKPLARATHELVCGERRHRASLMAGVATIPVMVRELTDDQVLEIQIVENLQRDDLTELEEADGYDQLMQQSKLNADQVGAKIGKSRTYVYNRLKLLNLATEGRSALREGKIDHSVALLVARIPDGKQQAKFLLEVLKGRGYHNSEPLSYRQAQELAQNTYMLKLSDARFTITVADLVPGVGSCKDCSKRTGADPDLFSDVKSADVCTDPPCFHKKQEAAAKLMVKEAEAKGQTVIAGREAEELRVGYGNQARFKGYKRLDSKEDSPTDEPLRKLIGKLMDEKGIKPTMLESMTKPGKLEACLPNDVANSLLKAVQEQAKANKKATPPAVQDLLNEKATQEKARLDAKFHRDLRAQIIAETWAEIKSNSVTFKAQGFFTLEVHRHLAEKAAWNLDSDASETVCKLLDLGAIGARHGLDKHVEKATDPDRLHLLFLLHARSGDGFDLVTDAVWGAQLKSTLKAIEAEVRKRVYPKPTPEKQRPPIAPAAQAKHAVVKGKKLPAARAPKLSAEDAKSGIADAMQSAERAATTPPETPQGLSPANAWPFPNDKVTKKKPTNSFNVGQAVRVKSNTQNLRPHHFKLAGEQGTIKGQDLGSEEWDVLFGKRMTKCFFASELEAA